MNLLISDLPREILAYILELSDSSYLVIDLWKTGDPKLQHKLSTCITKLDIRDTNPLSTSRWPKLISSLSKLQSLYIDRRHSWIMDSAAHLSREMQLLPPSLTSISLFSEDASTVLIELSRAGNAFQCGSIGTSVMGLSSLLPSLQTLKIGCDEDKTVVHVNLAGLPQTLTCLHLPSNLVRGNSSAFPQGLTELDQEPEGISWDGKLPLPPGLSSLRIGNLGVYDPMARWLLNLPQSLTALRLPCQDDQVVLPLSAIALLPRNLNELEMETSVDNDATYSSSDQPQQVSWPISLTSLALIYDSCCFGSHVLATLPPQLTHLSIDTKYFVPPPYVTGTSSFEWPSSLTSLRLEVQHDQHLPLNLDLHLSPALQKLYLDVDLTTLTTCRKFPPNITDLRLYERSSFRRWSISADLPPSLVTLIAPKASLKLNQIPTSVTRLKVDKILKSASTPSQTDSSSSASTASSASSLSQWPPHLLKLSLGTLNMSMASDLPSSLVKLRIDALERGSSQKASRIVSRQKVRSITPLRFSNVSHALVSKHWHC